MFNPVSTILMAAWMPPDRLEYTEVSSNDQKIFVTFNLLKVRHRLRKGI